MALCSFKKLSYYCSPITFWRPEGLSVSHFLIEIKINALDDKFPILMFPW